MLRDLDNRRASLGQDDNTSIIGGGVTLHQTTKKKRQRQRRTLTSGGKISKRLTHSSSWSRGREWGRPARAFWNSLRGHRGRKLHENVVADNVEEGGRQKKTNCTPQQPQSTRYLYPTVACQSCRRRQSTLRQLMLGGKCAFRFAFPRTYAVSELCAGKGSCP